jgi:hypothetical protein
LGTITSATGGVWNLYDDRLYSSSYNGNTYISHRSKSSKSSALFICAFNPSGCRAGSLSIPVDDDADDDDLEEEDDGDDDDGDDDDDESSSSSSIDGTKSCGTLGIDMMCDGLLSSSSVICLVII